MPFSLFDTPCHAAADIFAYFAIICRHATLTPFSPLFTLISPLIFDAAYAYLFCRLRHAAFIIAAADDAAAAFAADIIADFSIFAISPRRRRC